MQTHDQLIEELMRRPGVQAEVLRIEREEGGFSSTRCSKLGKRPV